MYTQTFGGENMFIILIMVMGSLVYEYAQTPKLYILNMGRFLYIKGFPDSSVVPQLSC